MMNIMKIVIVCFVILTTCFAVENTTLELEQQIRVQKREKQYLIEDDPNESPEQKRDERQSTMIRNNNNLDPKGNSRIINIRINPNIVTAPNKQVLKAGVLQKPINGRFDTIPQRIPTKIPIIIKTPKVVPGPAHALRLKMLENKINETISNLNKENSVCPTTMAPSTLSKNNIPYFTIEDKTTRSGHNQVDDENSKLESNVILNRDSKDSSDNNGNKNSNNSLNEGNKNQVPSDTDREATAEVMHKPVHFFVDEPEPLPPSNRKQYNPENIEMTANKPKEIPIIKKGHNKPKKEESRRKDHENNDDFSDSNTVRMSNGTHIISIKKIRDHDKYKNDRLVSREGEGYAPTEERIVNQPTLKPKLIADEPDQKPLGIQFENKNMDLAGLVFRDNKGGKDHNECITIATSTYEEFQEKSQIPPTVTLQQTNPLMTYSQGSPVSTWNYLQNTYHNPYDQYRRNYGATINPNIYGQEMNDPTNFGVQVINPCIYNRLNTNPSVANSEVILPYYPNGYPPTETDSTQYPYYPNQPEIDNTVYPVIRPDVNQDVLQENISDRFLKNWKDVDIKVRHAQTNDTDQSLGIDIRRNTVDKNDGNKGDNVISKAANPYVTSSMPINLNGALVYPYYVSPGYRYGR